MEQWIVHNPNNGDTFQLGNLADYSRLMAHTALFLSQSGRAVARVVNKSSFFPAIPCSRHQLTPLPASDKYAIAMRLGLEMFKRYGLMNYRDRVGGLVRKNSRELDHGFVHLHTGRVYGPNYDRAGRDYCIAIAPEPEPKSEPRTALDLLRDMVNEQPSDELRDEVQEFLNSEGAK